MNPIQESKQELEASIRYAENAISSAKKTIDSMATYQEQTGREQALQAQVKLLEERIADMTSDMVGDANTINNLKAQVNALEQPEKPTMPVIPKAVAIAIFREGVQSGVVDAISELEGQTINICENEYCGDFEVTFARDIHLDDELDFEWMRDKVGQYEEEFVVGALKGLCALKEFECRIHGIDDQEEKKND